MTISKKSMKWIPWILILPVVIIRGFTTLYPIIVTLKNSLFDVKVLSGVNKFVGLANYVNVFKDPKVQTSISFTVEFVVVSMVFHVVLGVILALILNMKFKGRRFLRTIVLIPWAMPAVVIGMEAKWQGAWPPLLWNLPGHAGGRHRVRQTRGGHRGRQLQRAGSGVRPQGDRLHARTERGYRHGRHAAAGRLSLRDQGGDRDGALLRRQIHQRAAQTPL